MPRSKHHHSSRRRIHHHNYFSRHRYDTKAEELLRRDQYASHVGIYSLWAVLWGCLFILAPLSYIYIAMVLIRELFGHHLLRISALPFWLQQWTLASAISRLETEMDRALEGTLEMIPRRQWLWFWIEVWCYLEAIFYIILKIRIRWMQCQDPLEASFSAAPLMELPERASLWKNMMDSEDGNIIALLSGWFFDGDVTEAVSAYDIRDFLAWCMFEGRHQEHLTTTELEQLEDFVEELQYRISLELYGEAEEDESFDVESPLRAVDESMETMEEPSWKGRVARPKKLFQFDAETQNEDSSDFFSNLFESYRRRYDQIDFHPVQDLRNMMQKAAGDNFHPVQDFQKMRKMMAETAQNIAEGDAMATASQQATKVYESLVPPAVDKQLAAARHATSVQLQQAWDSVRAMNNPVRLETARFLSKQRQRLQQQLKGYRVMLDRMRDMSSGVPSKQMAALMRRITDCHEAMEGLEGRAQTAFVQITGYALKNLTPRREPQRYAKYSVDPIMSIATYPLCFHMLLLGGTEIPLRIMLYRRGFERRTVGPVSYYFHPGATEDDGNEMEVNEKTPFVFVHGIGIGLIPYIPLIDSLLESGRPIYLPEIPYVSGFRPWQSSNAVLPPAVVTSTMVAMLATHGHLSATWMGHSYGTSWLSYMVKYAPETVAAVLFLDPICFCLHFPRLTKQFVYTMPDPGTISYIIRTDLIVNRTIQRAFPWTRIILFAEQIKVPCGVYLSEKDALVPSEKIMKYLQGKGVPVNDFEEVRQQLEESTSEESSSGGESASTTSSSESDSVSQRIHCTIMYGEGHGGWTERPHSTAPVIAHAAEVLCRQGERLQN